MYAKEYETVYNESLSVAVKKAEAAGGGAGRRRWRRRQRQQSEHRAASRSEKDVIEGLVYSSLVTRRVPRGHRAYGTGSESERISSLLEYVNFNLIATHLFPSFFRLEYKYELPI